MSSFLLHREAKLELARFLRSKNKPPTIDWYHWSGLRDGSLCAVPQAIFGNLIDEFGYSEIVSMLEIEEKVLA